MNNKNVIKINKIITEATEVVKRQPEPLRKSPKEATKFPIDSLPALFKDAVMGLHDEIQAPIAICSQSVLAVANLATQGHVDIQLPMKQRHPISCLFLTIAESGERKSSCDNEILSVIENYEKELSMQYGQKQMQWKMLMMHGKHSVIVFKMTKSSMLIAKVWKMLLIN